MSILFGIRDKQVKHPLKPSRFSSTHSKL